MYFLRFIDFSYTLVLMLLSQIFRKSRQRPISLSTEIFNLLHTQFAIETIYFENIHLYD